MYQTSDWEVFMHLAPLHKLSTVFCPTFVPPSYPSPEHSLIGIALSYRPPFNIDSPHVPLASCISAVTASRLALPEAMPGVF